MIHAAPLEGRKRGKVYSPKSHPQHKTLSSCAFSQYFEHCCRVRHRHVGKFIVIYSFELFISNILSEQVNRTNAPPAYIPYNCYCWRDSVFLLHDKCTSATLTWKAFSTQNVGAFSCAFCATVTSCGDWWTINIQQETVDMSNRSNARTRLTYFPMTNFRNGQSNDYCFVFLSLWRGITSISLSLVYLNR